MTTGAVRVGLAGTGQWARDMHAPLHASPGPTELVGVWGRSPSRAAALAQRHGVRAYADFAAMLADVDAVDFAVPPQVQSLLGVQAAAAGRALMLEKPLASTLAGAEQLVQAIRAAGVPTLVAMTRRYDPSTRAFLERAAALGRAGLLRVQGTFTHGGLLPGGFIAPHARVGWRAEHGMLYDLGPHLLDLVDAAAGPIVRIGAHGDLDELICLQTWHESDALGQLAVSGRVGTAGSVFEVDLLGHRGRERLDGGIDDLAVLCSTMRQEFADAVRSGTRPTVDAERALQVQRLLDAAVRSLTSSGDPTEVLAADS